VNDEYRGLEPENRGGCLIAGLVGLVALFFELLSLLGDPAPGEDDVWRHIPIFLPTLMAAALAFFVGRALIRRWRSRR
jgi:hypothetical protein